ncbi:LuxR C-terminal-related transcriptional regulator [Actinosynnema sp. NPDC020468]|uniref:helix-turn-helix transcriptional regulator n=1 Tax=Actinosynnema sp. NPDC020468 TaxID=3154488 RepID=UPI0033C97DC4
MHHQHEYLSRIQVQRELGLSARHVAELIASRRLPAFRVLGRWRIERVMLDRLVEELYDESADAVRALTTLPDDAPADPAAEPACEPAAEDHAVPLPRAGRQEFPAGLTEQQRRIVRLIGEGMSNAEIAADLFVEISTVKSHVSRILQRCALRDREQLIVTAWRSGLMGHDRERSRSVAEE